MSDVRIFHYTIGIRLAEILRTRVITPSDASLEPGERPVVWLTSSEAWDATANKVIFDPKTGERRGLSQCETEELGRGLFRIEVSSHQVLSWEAYKKLGKTSQEMCRALERTAIAVGSNPDQWFVAFHPIPVADWLDIERWAEDRWTADFSSE